MPLKRALIITYYWPPTGGPGVQRWLKFVKYMRQYGWEPIVYTPLNPERQFTDESLAKDIPEGIEILRTPIREPLTIAKMLFKKKAGTNLGSFSATKKKTITQQLLLWARANLFIPDPRITWVLPSVKYLERYLKEHPVDIIVSTSTPQSVHLIAYALKKKLGVKWLADFRDPWTKMSFFDELPLTQRSLRRHAQLEKKVLQEADVITVVGSHMVKQFDAIYHRPYEVVTNGYDTDDYAGLSNPPLDKQFTLTHIGTLSAQCNHPALWQALSELCNELPGFRTDMRLRFAGKVPDSIYDSIRAAGLGDNLIIEPYVPHNEVFAMQASAQVLMLIIAATRYPQQIVTGKLFEYLAVKRPILAIAPPDGDAAAIVTQANAGAVAAFNDVTGMKETLKLYYTKYKEGALQLDNPHIEQYTRQKLTGIMCTLLSNA